MKRALPMGLAGDQFAVDVAAVAFPGRCTSGEGGCILCPVYRVGAVVQGGGLGVGAPGGSFGLGRADLSCVLGRGTCGISGAHHPLGHRLQGT